MQEIKNDIDSVLLQHASIINIYRENKGIDKKSISNMLGISLPTVYNSINTLKSIGILKDAEKTTIAGSKEKGSNRNETVVELVPEFAYCAAISIGASLCKFVLLDLDFEMMGWKEFKIHKTNIIENLKGILSKQELLRKSETEIERNYIYFNTPSSFLELKRALDVIFSYLISLMKDNTKKFRLLSIGVTCTGIVNEKEKIIQSANNLEYIENTTLDNFFFPDKISYFREKNVGIELIQNCNAAVIAEKITLSKSPNISVRNKKNVVAIYLGVGLGAGFYFDRLYTGATGYCGEIGHLPAPVYKEEEDFNSREHSKDELEKLDKKCSCGSLNCYDYKIHKYVFSLSTDEFKEKSSEKLKDLLCDSDTKVKLLGKYLGNIVNTITTLLDVDVIVFTGKLYKSMHLLYNQIAEVQDETTVKFSRNDCVLVTSKYGPSAPAVGAAIYSYYKKYGLELRW